MITKTRTTVLLILIVLLSVSFAGLRRDDAVNLSEVFASQSGSFSGWADLGSASRAKAMNNLAALVIISDDMVDNWQGELAALGLSEENVAVIWGKLKKIEAKLGELGGISGKPSVSTAQDVYAKELVATAHLFYELGELYAAAGL